MGFQRGERILEIQNGFPYPGKSQFDHAVFGVGGRRGGMEEEDGFLSRHLHDADVPLLAGGMAAQKGRQVEGVRDGGGTRWGDRVVSAILEEIFHQLLPVVFVQLAFQLPQQVEQRGKAALEGGGQGALAMFGVFAHAGSFRFRHVHYEHAGSRKPPHEAGGGPIPCEQVLYYAHSRQDIRKDPKRKNRLDHAYALPGAFAARFRGIRYVRSVYGTTAPRKRDLGEKVKARTGRTVVWESRGRKILVGEWDKRGMEKENPAQRPGFLPSFSPGASKSSSARFLAGRAGQDGRFPGRTIQAVEAEPTRLA